MQTFTLEPRHCACCGRQDVEPLWSNHARLHTPQETYAIGVQVVVCRYCGFCFNSPCPPATELNAYYADAVSVGVHVPLAYAIAPRVELLRRHVTADTRFVEIGGNRADAFHTAVRQHVASVCSVEINRECSADAYSPDDLQPGSADVVAHYEVLEHIPDVRAFLTSCHNLLCDGGVMICEVPNVRTYPRNLMLYTPVHLNHFSPATLGALGEAMGFELLEIGHATASRPFSVAVVFRKAASRPRDGFVSPNRLEYLEARACVRGGMAQITRYMDQIRAVRERMRAVEAAGQSMVLWCVTDLLQSLLDNFELPRTTVVVDADPRKHHLLRDQRIEVRLPEGALDALRTSALLVICSPRNREHILGWIRQHAGRVWDAEAVAVLAAGPYGEPLQV